MALKLVTLLSGELEEEISMVQPKQFASEDLKNKSNDLFIQSLD